MNTKAIAPALVTLLLSLPLLAPQLATAAEPMPPPAVLETFLCTWKPGKGMDDLMAAKDYFVKQSQKASLALHDSYVWTLYKGAGPAQVIWHTPYENLNAWAAASDAGFAKPEMAEVDARFDAVTTCTPVMGTVRPIYMREGMEEPTQETFVASSACRLKDGADRTAIADLTNHIAGVTEGMGDKAPRAAYVITPMTRGPQTPDVVFFNVNDSASSWAAFVEQLLTTDAGAALGRHFNAIVDCDLSLWGGRQVIDDGM